MASFEYRKIKFGKVMYQELTGIKRPVLDKSNILHWPVVLLYAEVMSSDIIEDFCETDMFSAHLDMISFTRPFVVMQKFQPLPGVFQLGNRDPSSII